MIKIFVWATMRNEGKGLTAISLWFSNKQGYFFITSDSNIFYPFFSYNNTMLMYVIFRNKLICTIQWILSYISTTSMINRYVYVSNTTTVFVINHHDRTHLVVLTHSLHLSQHVYLYLHCSCNTYDKRLLNTRILL